MHILVASPTQFFVEETFVVMKGENVKKSCLCADLWKTCFICVCVCVPHVTNLLWFLMLTFKEEETLSLFFLDL